MQSDDQFPPSLSTPERPIVLVVEDDRQLQRIMKRELEGVGFEVLLASGETELLPLLAGSKFDLVVLDLAINGDPYKGFELVPKIRSTRCVPVVVVSGHSQPWDRLRALELGVDDYITKPFLMKEVEIRLRRLIGVHRAEQSLPDMGHFAFSFAGLRLDPVRRRLEAQDGSEISLTETEFNILKHLLFAEGRIVTRDDLWRALRGQEWSPLDRALDGHIARLRAKLEPGVERPQIIKSVRGVGYVVAVPVSRVRN